MRYLVCLLLFAAMPEAFAMAGAEALTNWLPTYARHVTAREQIRSEFARSARNLLSMLSRSIPEPQRIAALRAIKARQDQAAFLIVSDSLRSSTAALEYDCASMEGFRACPIEGRGRLRIKLNAPTTKLSTIELRREVEDLPESAYTLIKVEVSLEAFVEMAETEPTVEEIQAYQKASYPEWLVKGNAPTLEQYIKHYLDKLSAHQH